MSAVLDPPTAAATPWRSALLALAAVMLVLGGLYADTVTAMVGIWQRSETFAHAFLVPPIVLWLVWRQRATLSAPAERGASASAMRGGEAAWRDTHARFEGTAVGALQVLTRYAIAASMTPESRQPPTVRASRWYSPTACSRWTAPSRSSM